jgi:cytochrome o ubiquinol oxidase subunit 2
VPENVKPLVVEVVALGLKWLFIYPEQGIALVNEMAATITVRSSSKITSIMNHFHSCIGGANLRHARHATKLSAVINKPGEFDGFGELQRPWIQWYAAL